MFRSHTHENLSCNGHCVFTRTPRHWIPIALTLYIAVIFIQSLFFKFTDSPETQHIFSTLDTWAAGFGFSGLFNPGGIFSAKVIGSFELLSSLLLLAALATRLTLLRVAGSVVAIGIISGAIFFHLFTPLGVVVQDDGGLLFAMACGIWISAAILLFRDRVFIVKFLKNNII